MMSESLRGTLPFSEPKFSNFSALHILLGVVYLLDTFWLFNYSSKINKIEKKSRFQYKNSKIFFVLSSFSQIDDFQEKSAESPPFLKHGTSDRAEIFSASSRKTLECILFFILKILYRWFLADLIRETLFKKKMRFLGCSPYFDFSIRRERDTKKRNKVGTSKCL
jgi:hypothetical protein